MPLILHWGLEFIIDNNVGAQLQVVFNSITRRCWFTMYVCMCVCVCVCKIGLLDIATI